MSHILCIDDEAAILRLLGVVLARDGHKMLPAANAREALALIKAGGVDAVLLDLGLPDRDGLELIGPLRAHAPVLVVSARSDVQEKVAALDLGAVDYLTKPFDGDELLARLRVALRASAKATPAPDVLEYGPLRMDLARHELQRDGQLVGLTPKEFALLQALMQAAGRIQTHAALLEQVWGKAHRDDVDYLRVAIRALRLKLEADPAQPSLIRNEPGIGYRLG
jgi:two-component system KDP operon response regulator KdpE